MIAYFVYKLDSYSGAAQQALLLAKTINQKILIFNHNNGKYKVSKVDDLIEVVDLPSNSLIKAIIILYKTITKKINIYHFHGFFTIGLFLGIFTKRKLILKTTLLGSDDFKSLKESKRWRINKFLLKHIDFNIVLSKKLKEINSNYIDKTKIRLIPNGVLLQNNLMSIEQKKQNFCYVGLVCERKRTYESILYFIQNYSKINNAFFTIVGPYKNVKNNPEFDENYVKKCFDLIKENKMEDRISFTGLISKKETQNILNKSKCLLFFSSKEGLPNVVLEAMSNNCVPITSELDGVISEIFNHKEAGFILNDTFDKVPINLIDQILLKKKPFLVMKQKYDINLIANQYKLIYENR
ncbi:glycosyltransferase family 4 protein [Tenacibaculum dicentrarchi]|uniref:Glycosyl transferase, group 1 family protein n=1 Tax=Tenacibaculum dicentrarchi TaxID=669041 RepID=A0ABM9NSH4_9FLAO|nr:glycosyltransferase family 4 protein [Tenacibaculum dicentrarchi]MCD8408190.1 glycosyltransferase family 4 protein [Tenacibaculum dicentrarchi]MCD8415807.1 glycosyltransferase family 4 protein [Tenacibaculum dicentrarchi]MCD8420931.1 glycosyltransferase family 4 protein [Tenacibaculum dicentrarchi]MCD8425794.1 glycosyltransferase family 4 protein [Tenacibaculum dicentrarchi]